LAGHLTKVGGDLKAEMELGCENIRLKPIIAHYRKGFHHEQAHWVANYYSLFDFWLHVQRGCAHLGTAVNTLPNTNSYA
jgi:hypothetical protein